MYQRKNEEQISERFAVHFVHGTSQMCAHDDDTWVKTHFFARYMPWVVDKCSRARQSRFGKPHASYYFKQQSVPKGFVFIKQGEKTSEPWSRTCKSTKDDKSPSGVAWCYLTEMTEMTEQPNPKPKK